MDSMMSYLMIFIFVIFCYSTFAFTIRHFTVFQNEIEAQVNNYNLIPCEFHTVHQLRPDVVSLAWRKANKDNNDFTPVIQLHGTQLETDPNYEGKYNLFTPLVSKGNCSLIFRPSDIEDGGSFDAQLVIKGKVFTTSKIYIKVVTAESRAAKIHITDAPMRKDTAVTTKGDFVDKIIVVAAKGNVKIIVIVVLAMSGGIGLILIIVITICCCRRKHKVQDEENPQKSNSKTKKESDDEKSDDEDSDSTYDDDSDDSNVGCILD